MSLGWHRQLSPTAGVHVSPIALGAISIGDKWDAFGMGAMDKKSSFKLLDAFYEAGGNFVDTANIYRDETSEEFIGEWMETRGIRDQIVVATKYTSNFKRGNDGVKPQTHYVGNNIKSLYLPVEASLKKLRTSYIDILYLHWAIRISIGITGVSDTPAWVVSKAKTYARMSGKTPLVIYQGAWNVLQRDFERDIIPMARAEGMALAPWNEVAREVGAKSIQAVAIAYLMQKAPYVFPLVGGRKVEHLLGNLEALQLSLTEGYVKRIEGAVPFDPAFPHGMIGNGTQYQPLFTSAGHFDKWPIPEPIHPSH
ncbi:NADP-dependent oxidoreductase domain-containing protein [Trametes meyenii]|nr:NADP-dependent oxidoreductase domain-containing protein [Trametes meyenii]